MPSVALENQIEARTQQIGREMFDRIRADRRSIFSAEWWEERLLAQCMRNERLKVQAFRFIDVLPTMNDDRDVARHLREYFADPDLLNGAAHGGSHGKGGAGLQPAGRAGSPPHPSHEAGDIQAALAELDPSEGRRFTRFLARAMNFDRLDSPAARLAVWAARKSSVKMAHRFIAGTNIREAERAIRRMRSQKMAFTIDVLGEAALSDAESLHYHKIYDNLIVELSRHSREWPRVEQIDLAGGVAVPRVNVSVKLSSLFSQFDAIDPDGTKRVVKERLRPLLRAGMSHGAHIHIDMEHYAVKTLTLEICREVFMEHEFRDYPHFGVVLQAYLKDCERDARGLLDWAARRGVPIWVRLVKGAYWDTETVLAQQQHWPCPVWERKWQSDANFERINRLLIENHRHVRTAVASHNVRSLAHGMALREAFEVPGTAFELQMLYGMGDPIKRAGVEMGQRCRIYTPYGELLPGMAYLIRRLLENTANESFLRHSNAEDASVDELLEDPLTANGDTLPPATFPPATAMSGEQVGSGRFDAPTMTRYEFEEPLMYDFENVPNTDFTIEDNRAKMRAALDAVRTRFNAEYPLVVGSERITTGQWKESNNPSRPAEIIGKVAQADEATARKAVDVAAEAFRDWRWVEPEERADTLFRVAEIMQRRRFDLAAIEVLECGKPWREADADVSEAIDFCNYYAHEMIRMAENVRRRDIPGETNEYYYAPRGVVAVISPWNFPLAILTGMAVAAVVTGNTVIIKPATPQMVIAYELMAMFEEAGLPPGVMNYLPGPGSMVGEILVKHPKVAMIAFTGSREVGCRINRVAAETTTSQPALKKVIAEMGGKNAAIVDSDADLDEAVKGVLYAAFGYAGQKCSACSRCIVLDGAYEQFVPRLIEAARSMQVGPADDPGTFVPPVIDANAAKTIREYIDIGKREAECALETDVSGLIEQTAGGSFIGPTIFTGVAPDARIAREEIFGPVLAVIRAPDMETAIDIFNNTDYALTGGIFSRSPANIEKARRECECGNFYINRRISGALVDLQPFGGFKMSGLGSKAGGPDYLIQFCEPRSVTENTLRRGFAPSEDVVELLG